MENKLTQYEREALEKWDVVYPPITVGYDGNEMDCVIRESQRLFLAQSLQGQRKVIEDKYKDALIWCSGSEDFQVGGKAREGWEKICLPLLSESNNK